MQCYCIGRRRPDFPVRGKPGKIVQVSTIGGQRIACRPPLSRQHLQKRLDMTVLGGWSAGSHSAALELIVRQNFLYRLHMRVRRKRAQKQRARSAQHQDNQNND